MVTDYYLCRPSQEYSQVFAGLREKIDLTEGVIKVVEDSLDSSGDISYDDFVEKISEWAPDKQIHLFGEEQIMENAQFILSQVESSQFFKPKI